MTPLRLALAAALFALAGCDAPIRAAAIPCVVLNVGDATATDTAVVLGQVRAPANVLADGPRDASPLQEKPVAGAEVYLADATRLALPGLAHATTDADGRYRIAGVPGGHTYVVVAAFPLKSGAPARLDTLAQATSGAVTADVTLATAVLTANLADVLNGFSSNLKQDAYDGTVAKALKLLTNDRVPDLTDTSDVLGLANTLLSVSPELRTSVSQLKQDLATSAAPPLIE
jgi:hypothetical protein